ncbi:hypothetical protein [Aquimarina latercula]|uniref:hypothetical protein n=1 Tax=Aquimarina latercula TaxID=987 RepID=UPI0003F82B18|nr:hypothetical protein [Aquimarina latercula]
MTHFKNVCKTTLLLLLLLFQITPLIVSAKISATYNVTVKSIDSYSENTNNIQNQLSIINAPTSVTKNAGERYKISVFYTSSGRAEIALKNKNENWKTYAFHSVDVVNGQTEDYYLEVSEDILSISPDLVWEVKVNNGDDGYVSKSVKIVDNNEFFLVNSPSAVKREIGKKYKISINYPRGTDVEIALRDRNNRWKTHAFLQTPIENNGVITHIIEITEEISNKTPKMFWEIKITNKGFDAGYLTEFVSLEDNDINELSILDAPANVTGSKGITYNLIVAHSHEGIAQVSLKDKNNDWKIHAFKEIPVINGRILTHELLTTQEVTNDSADLVWEVKILYNNTEIAYNSQPVSWIGQGSRFNVIDKIKIFPIPFNEQLSINASDPNNIKKIEILEYKGNIVYSSDENKIPVTISTVNLKNKTIYLLRVIKNNGAIETTKIYKN